MDQQDDCRADSGDDGGDRDGPDRPGDQGHEADRQQLRGRREHQDLGQGRRPRRSQPLGSRDGGHQTGRADAVDPLDIDADLSAESTNGSIILDRIDSSNVDLYTVNGNISYDGPIKDKGLYRLTTHNGLIAIAVPERANITLSGRTYNGSIRSTFALP